MLSRDTIWVPHTGHRDRGATTDSPAGTRDSTTVMKLPYARPNGIAIRMRTSVMAGTLADARIELGRLARLLRLAEVHDALGEAGDRPGPRDQRRLEVDRRV